MNHRNNKTYRLNKYELIILWVICLNPDCTIEFISSELGFPIVLLNKILINLLLKGYIEHGKPNHYNYVPSSRRDDSEVYEDGPFIA
jgi:hypothetical protein